MLRELQRRYREFPQWARIALLSLWSLPIVGMCAVCAFVDPPPAPSSPAPGRRLAPRAVDASLASGVAAASPAAAPRPSVVDVPSPPVAETVEQPDAAAVAHDAPGPVDVQTRADSVVAPDGARSAVAPTDASVRPGGRLWSAEEALHGVTGDWVITLRHLRLHASTFVRGSTLVVVGYREAWVGRGPIPSLGGETPIALSAIACGRTYPETDDSFGEAANIGYEPEMAVPALNPSPARDLTRALTVPTQCLERGIRLVFQHPRRPRVVLAIQPL